MVITAPGNTFMANKKCLVVNYGLFVVQVGTASFTSVVGMAMVTAWLIYGQIYGTDTLDLLDFKHSAHVPCLKLYTT